MAFHSLSFDMKTTSRFYGKSMLSHSQRFTDLQNTLEIPATDEIHMVLPELSRTI